MKVLGVIGPHDAGKTTLLERLVERLEGRVGTIKHLGQAPDVDTGGKDTARHRAAGAATTIGLHDGEWFATGEDLQLADALDRLAPDHDYALLEGFSDAAIPQVVLGEQDHAGETIVSAPSAEHVDVDAIVEALADVEPHVTLASLVADVKRSPAAERAGAVATFTGRVRAKVHPDDVPTEYLEFEKYDDVADEQLSTIAEELRARDGVHEVALHHRTGILEAGEDIVFVVVLAGHRAEAFDAVEDGIDRLKAEVPLFKKEVTVEEDFWAHDRP